MDTYTIGELADRSGFSASALRFYEGIGLVTPTARTDAGYRIYDERALARLAFIARAKQLGCSLDEIGDLVTIWDSDRCGPVQRRFHDLITSKLADAGRQISELSSLSAELHHAAAQLQGEPVDGPCSDGCACLADAAPATRGPVAMGMKGDGPPIACTLTPGDLPDRLADWHAVLARAGRRTLGADGMLRVELADDVGLDELTRLVVAEQGCCAFFAFAITVDGRGVGLEVRAPDGATDLVTSLFGQPA
jgi:DNA-binding transcriptional MerR regulator